MDKCEFSEVQANITLSARHQIAHRKSFINALRLHVFGRAKLANITALSSERDKCPVFRNIKGDRVKFFTPRFVASIQHTKTNRKLHRFSLRRLPPPESGAE